MTSEDNLIICQTIKLFDDVSFLRQLRSVLYLSALRLGQLKYFLTEQERVAWSEENNKLNRLSFFVGLPLNVSLE